ncbi:ankyrin repeat-containing domain protein [Aspergillus keveii]|uniref:Ankyrin repeat-containing domain protein n=1 Tax=Aspergillus keveii TaxID=714993 RepID=A0ABR4FGW1_9EURO
MNGHEAVMELLLQTAEVDVNAHDKELLTPLHFAASNGREAVVRLLLQTAGVDLNATDRIMNTPLHDAVLNGHVATVKLLLQTAGVDVNLQNADLRTPLMCAERECRKVVPLFLQENRLGDTPLHQAREDGRLRIAELFLKNGADPNFENKSRDTPWQSGSV